jgi:hypothetical protein
MGPGFYGADAAARDFYHIHASDMTMADASSLVCCLPNPLHRDPNWANRIWRLDGLQIAMDAFDDDSGRWFRMPDAADELNESISSKFTPHNLSTNCHPVHSFHCGQSGGGYYPSIENLYLCIESMTSLLMHYRKYIFLDFDGTLNTGRGES